MSATTEAYRLALIYLRDKKGSVANDANDANVNQEDVADVVFEYGRLIVNLEEVLNGVKWYEDSKGDIK